MAQQGQGITRYNKVPMYRSMEVQRFCGCWMLDAIGSISVGPVCPILHPKRLIQDVCPSFS